MSKTPDRQTRLAEALRQNLRRRKARAKEPEEVKPKPEDCTESGNASETPRKGTP